MMMMMMMMIIIIIIIIIIHNIGFHNKYQYRIFKKSV